MNYLEIIANVAEVSTAGVAWYAYNKYRLDLRRKRQKLEDYLKAEKKDNPAKKTHTTLHLMAQLGLTEAEILTASFSSLNIVRKEHINPDTRLTDQILFEYQEPSFSN